MFNKTKSYVFIIAGVFFLLQSLHAQAVINVWWVNGEVWIKLNNTQKSLYVQGFVDGLGFAETKIKAERKIQVEPSISFSSFEQIHKALDQFYSDYKNELIPVSLALKVLSMELNGESKEAVEKELQRLRRQVQDERKNKKHNK